MVNSVVLFFWSVDYALISTVLFFLFFAFFMIVKKKVFAIIQYLVFLFASCLLLVCFLGLERVKNLFNYYYIDIRNDQYWYFAPWDVNSVENLELIKGLFLGTGLWLHFFILFMLIIKVFQSGFDPRFLFLLYLGVTLFSAGLISTIGGHQGGYFWAFKSWGRAIVGVLIVSLMVYLVRTVVRNGLPSIFSKEKFVALFVFGSIGLLIAYLSFGLARYSTSVHSDPTKYYEPKLGGLLNVAQRPLFELPTDSLLEEYSGILGVISKGPLPFFQVDSNIHALGSKRGISERTLNLKPPSIVTTTSPHLSKQWVSWNISANWWFYKTLFSKYSPTATTPSLVVWRKTENQNWQTIGCLVQRGRIVIPQVSLGLIDVTLTKKGSVGILNQGYSMIRNNLNIVESGDGFVAINPRKHSFNFPAIQKEQKSDLILEYFGNEPMTLNSCSARYLDIRNSSGGLWKTYKLYFR